MAVGHGQMRHPARRGRPAPLAGALAPAGLGALAGGAFLGLLLQAAGDWRSLAGYLDPYLWRVARFTLLQAVLSTLLSVLPALAVARAISRHPDFPGREWLLRLFGVPLALPALVAALGVLALYGRAGLLAPALAFLSGGSWGGIYGLSGILVAHVFFNLPLATRLFLEALETIPNDQWRLAEQLGMGPSAQWRLIEWPVLRATLPGIAGLVLMLCVTSFTIVLTLGGGPGAATLEVAIYQALRFDFDPARAVILTLVQLGLTLALLVVMGRLGGHFTAARELNLTRRRFSRPAMAERLVNAAWIGAAAIFVLGPMLAVMESGLSADLVRLAGEAAVHRAILTSLILALAAALLSVSLSLGLVSARKRLELARRTLRPGMVERAMEIAPLLVLAVPPIVIGAGWFVLLRHFGNVFVMAPAMVVIVNAAMAMPFVVRAIRPAHDRSLDQHGKLAESLGISGFARLRLIEWPVLRRPLMTGFAFAMALSLGDLGVIALFGSDLVQTLPYLLLMRLGSYRTDDAAGLALILALLALGLMWIAARGEERS